MNAGAHLRVHASLTIVSLHCLSGVFLGDGASTALFIDSRLNKGRSEACSLLNSPPLCSLKGSHNDAAINEIEIEFSISDVEMFVFELDIDSHS